MSDVAQQVNGRLVSQSLKTVSANTWHTPVSEKP